MKEVELGSISYALDSAWQRIHRARFRNPAEGLEAGKEKRQRYYVRISKLNPHQSSKCVMLNAHSMKSDALIMNVLSY